MIPKYSVEYSKNLGRHPMTTHFGTDDPVSCEEFLAELLERRWPILCLKHDGFPLPCHESDRLIRNAAGMMCSRHLQSSLRVDSEQARARFGTSA